MKSNLGYISCTREAPQPMDYLQSSQCNYVSFDLLRLSCNVLLNGFYIDYIRHVLITIKKIIFCEIKQLIDRCFLSSQSHQLF